MAESHSHRWWAVNCLTAGCKTTIGLCHIGPSRVGRVHAVYMLKQCAPFKETCPVCGIEYTYHRPNVFQMDADPPPPRFQRSEAFPKALEPEPDHPGESEK